MNAEPATPSRYRLPQHCSADRQRARRATLALQRSRYLPSSDDGPGHPADGFRLPIAAAALPPGEAFSLEKTARLLAHKALLRCASPFVRLRVPARPGNARQYAALLGVMRRPHAMADWRSDAAFARQRLTGTNPMSLRLCADPPPGDLARAADRVLGEQHGIRLQAALDAGRLFLTDYDDVLDPRIQQQVAPGATLAAATCLFVRERQGGLAPIAIRLRTPRSGIDVVVTPLDRPADWLLARCHAQSADAHYHEGVFHLLETHMVSEVFALCNARQLHPDHPLQQLFALHFEGNLAINHLARTDLLSIGGPIDLVMAAGVGGTLDQARRIAEASTHAHTRAFIAAFAAALHQMLGDSALAEQYAAEAIAIGRVRGFALWVGFGGVLEGWARAVSGRDPDAAIRDMRQCLEQMSTIGMIVGSSYFLGVLADAQLAAGDRAGARASVDAASGFVEAYRIPYWAPEVLRLRARCREDEDPAAALLDYDRARELAHTQGARGHTLRIAGSAAALLRRLGRDDEAARRLDAAVAGLAAHGDSAAAPPVTSPARRGR